ncbi:MAG: glycosyltransferase [Actinomycetia bacterium]|nr:glycosyltransferase [Actinomycetes bacterium]
MPAGARPHMLYVVWGFPPCRGSGVYRALATANAFAREGYDVTVLTCEREVFLNYTGADLTLEQEVDPTIRVVRVPFSWPTLDPDVRGYSALRALAPRLWAKQRVRRDRLPFPETAYGPWRPVLEAAAELIHAERPVDLVVATANPHVTFAAAWRLHRRHGIPYVMDYRDAWSLDVFSGARVNGQRSRAGRWEARLVAGASEVWFVNDAIRDWHAATYPTAAARMHTVANGYDPEYAAEAVTRRPDPAAGLSFGYLGTISTKVPLAEFIAGWRLARTRSDVVARSTTTFHGYLGHYQLPNPALQAMLQSAAEDGVRHGGPIPKTGVREVYESHDVLLLVLGTGRYVTSGKVFEYLATGLPVVSVHDPGNAASDILRGYPLWSPVEGLAPEQIADAMLRAADASVHADEAIRAASAAFGRAFRRDAQLSPRVAALREVAVRRTAALPAGAGA